MLLYYITDRHSLDRDVVDTVAEALVAGVDLIQIREKDLSPRELFVLAQRVKELPNPGGSRILLNERLDIAVAAGLDGVHLPSSHLPIRELRETAGRPITVGVSCHSDAEVRAANDEGADLIAFSPVFAPLSKSSHIQPHGLAALESICATSSAPVFALGGVTANRIHDCLEAGAAGVAGISLFQSSHELTTLVSNIRDKPLSSP